MHAALQSPKYFVLCTMNSQLTRAQLRLRSVHALTSIATAMDWRCILLLSVQLALCGNADLAILIPQFSMRECLIAIAPSETGDYAPGRYLMPHRAP